MEGHQDEGPFSAADSPVPCPPPSSRVLLNVNNLKTQHTYNRQKAQDLGSQGSLPSSNFKHVHSMRPAKLTLISTF